ncbi:MAG: hypothetical protein ACYS5V_14825 [Planctomycetota bacterium]|jgi:hypothetical protein
MTADATSVYDEQALVDAIARGVMSYAEIAREQGVSRACVSQIARGVRRPELHGRIVERQEAVLMQARRLAVACAVQAMAVHIREGIEGKGETARKCREYLLNRALGAPGKPPLPAPGAEQGGKQDPLLQTLIEDLVGRALTPAASGLDESPRVECEGGLGEPDTAPRAEPAEGAEPPPEGSPRAAPAGKSQETAPPGLGKEDPPPPAGEAHPPAEADAAASAHKPKRRRRKSPSPPDRPDKAKEPTGPPPQPHAYAKAVLRDGLSRPG